MIKNIFFDFDGVLAESVHIKTESFRRLYLPFGEDIANNVVVHHLENGGMSRYEKFKIYHSWMGIDISEAEIDILSNQFSELVLDGVINSPEVNGVSEFLNTQYRNFNFWIISGTPTDEMRTIVKERHLGKYFIGIYGSPKYKSDWTEFIIRSHNLVRSETIFIGDARSDYEASKYSNLTFVLRETVENFDLFSNYNGIRVKDLINFLEIVKSL